MAEVVVFHHVQGLTPGVAAFAGELRVAGHTVHTPDLFDGRIFGSFEEGLGYVEQTGFGELTERGVRAAEPLPRDAFYVGFSLGVLPAQKLAQTRTGARGALLIHACIPVSEFGAAWPDRVPVQVHAKENDPFFAEDIGAARVLVSDCTDAEMFLYPGDQHLFADNSLPSHDPDAAKLLTQRAVEFLDSR
ncbi:dienelactone hydrolase family protein [Spirillospora sp. CA-142024]|uniref:dienelactone hydrolase family protein n=1 Tax=Spirillospora sp. CA-142024 TaxID=3240036 RepID=UPI003D8F5FC3